jgi:NAD(P)-dependent dehydrogenase (short-subunit alcohol dehydrogenase family)
MKLKDKVALITGGSSGIGRATALLFARAGAAVVVAARNEARGAALVREVAAQGQVVSEGMTAEEARALFVPTDVTLTESCAHVVEETLKAFGRLDILVNNAGVIVREKTVVDTTPEEWDLTFAVNVRGTYLMSRAALPHLPRGGSIVNNASYLGVVGGRGVAAYAAAKGAIINLTRAMALDHAPDGIRVNCVAPGSVETPMLHGEWEEMGGEGAVRHLFEGKHPLGRISQPAEIARTILFLASDEASFVTGVCLPVDGGITAG